MSRWSRAVALLCLFYLLTLLLVHRQLEPVNDRVDTDDYGDPSDDYVDNDRPVRRDKVPHPPPAASNSSSDKAWMVVQRDLKQELSRLGDGMTRLESEIAKIKTRLTEEAQARAAARTKKPQRVNQITLPLGQLGEGTRQWIQGQVHPNQAQPQWDQGRGQWDQGRGQWDEGRGPWDEGRGQFDEGRGQWGEGRDQRDQGQGQWYEVRGQFDEGRGQGNDGRDPWDQGRGQWDQGRGQFDEGRGQWDLGRGRRNQGLGHPLDKAVRFRGHVFDDEKDRLPLGGEMRPGGGRRPGAGVGFATPRAQWMVIPEGGGQDGRQWPGEGVDPWGRDRRTGRPNPPLFESPWEESLRRSLATEDYSNSSLLKIAQGVAVYSAFLDDRQADKPMVRLLLFVSAPKGKRSLLCHFNHPSLPEPLPVMAEEYELCENHNKRFLGFLYSCAVPEVTRGLAFTLTLSALQSEAPAVPVSLLNVKPPQGGGAGYPYGLSVCVSPLFGTVNPRRLVEFLELTRLVGVHQVFFYDFHLSPLTTRVLQHYKDKGWVTVLPWKLPEMMMANQIWYHGQLIANNDCLYRTMPLSAYTAFHDIDEVIVPHAPGVRTLGELLGNELPNNTCGYRFPSAFFDPGVSDGAYPDDLMTVALTARTRTFSRVRTKVVVDPRRVFEVGIHHISKQFLEHWQPQVFNTSLAFLHHYRRCISNYGMRCDGWIKDTVIRDLYYPQLRDGVKQVVRLLKL